MNQSSRRKYATTFTEDEEAAFRSRRKRITARTYWQSAFILIIIVTLSYLDRHGYFLAPKNDFDYYQNITATVVQVIDGDTLDINIPDRLHGTKTTRIRLWGVNCPETAKPPGFHDRRQATPAEPFANEATEFTQQQVMGKQVILHLEKTRVRGYYGRLLAHLIITNDNSINNTQPQKAIPLPIPHPDQTTLSAELLKAGLTRADNRWPHSLINEYQQLEERAKQTRMGLWNSSTHQDQ